MNEKYVIKVVNKIQLPKTLMNSDTKYYMEQALNAKFFEQSCLSHSTRTEREEREIKKSVTSHFFDTSCCSILQSRIKLHYIAAFTF